MKVCRRCGRYLHEGFSICPRDGAPLFSIDIEQQEIEQQMPLPDKETASGIRRAAQLRAVQAAPTSFWRASIVVPAGVVACLLIAVVVYFMVKEASANQSSVRSVDELIKQGEGQKALDILQKWRAADIQTAADMEKMDKLIIDVATSQSQNHKVNQAIALLSEISPHSPRQKEAAQLLKSLKQRQQGDN